MTYCISDIHDEYDLFMRLLDKIRYSDSDRLIVCGDFLDKGTSSIRLAKTIFGLPNSYSIMGNHEYAFFKLYRSLADDADNLDFDRILSQLQGYFPLRFNCIFTFFIHKFHMLCLAVYRGRDPHVFRNKLNTPVSPPVHHPMLRHPDAVRADL